MTLQNAFQQGFKMGSRLWRIAAIVYFLQLCLALTLGMQVFNVLEASIGNSLEISKLTRHYDHTVISDFLKVHGASITPLIGQLRWLVLVWLVFSVFIDGGLLACCRPRQSNGAVSGGDFWLNGAKWFFPFLKIALVFLLIAVLWSALIFLPVASFFEPSLSWFSSEKYSVWAVLLGLGVWLLGLAWLFAWSVFSRLEKMGAEKNSAGAAWGSPGTEPGIWKSIKTGWRTLLKNKGRVFALLLVFAALQALLVGLYFSLEAFLGMTSPVLILLMFLVQQAFVFFRVQLRLMVYAALAAVNTRA